MGLRLTKEGLSHSLNATSIEAAVCTRRWSRARAPKRHCANRVQVAMEDRQQVLAAVSGDVMEGVAAFFEKRPPAYKQ